MVLETCSLVGRELELRDLTARLDSSYVLTLIGPPGVGKSRLAAELVTRSGSPRSVISMDLADTAGVRTLRSTGESLTHQDRALILVLDNCDIALTDCRQFITGVLGRLPGVTILSTCRERLGLTLESVWHVQPLLPPRLDARFDAIAASPAVQLFVERAQTVNARFALTVDNAHAIANICRAVDGLPLAIELAANRMDVLTPEALAKRVDTAIRLVTGDSPSPNRHAGMGASLAWTTDRLSVDEQRLLWTLSVFDGTWDLPAAEAVWADRGTASDVPALLTRLVGSSLVQKLDQPHGTDVRYVLPGVVRRFALLRLERLGGSRTVRRRHAEWCRQVVESIPFGTGDPDALERLHLAFPTLVGALAWAVDAGEVDTALSLANVLHGLWFIRGEFNTSRWWFKRVLALPGGSGMTRAMVTNWASNHAIAQGDYAAALALSDQVRAAAAELQNPVLRAIGLDGLAVIHWEQGNIDRAEALFVEELELCSALGMTWLQCASLYRLAGIQIEKGFLDYAQELAEQALVRLGDDVNIWMQLRVLRVLGRVALERGDRGTAHDHLTSALEMASRIEDARGASEAHIDLAHLDADRDNGRSARRHLSEALDVCENTGELLILLRVLEAVIALRALARPEAVLNLAGAVTALRTHHGVQRPPLEQARYEAALERALTQVRRASGEQALVSGQALGRDAAARLARELLATNENDGARASDAAVAALTQREAEIAALVAQGLSNRSIGAELFIAEGTVRAHVEHILAKLGLKSRVEVAARLG